jgi:hypothetical protein
MEYISAQLSPMYGPRQRHPPFPFGSDRVKLQETDEDNETMDDEVIK